MPLKQQKSPCLTPWCANVQMYPTSRAASINYPTEYEPTFNTCSVAWMGILIQVGHILHIQYVQKKRPKCFFVISSDSDEFVTQFCELICCQICKRLPPHPNNVSTLPCETWNVHHAGATTELSEKETPEFIPSQLWPANSPDWILLITSCCKRTCTKHTSLIWINWNSDWEWSAPSWIKSSLRQPFVSGVVDSSRSVNRVLYTSLRYFTHAANVAAQFRWDKFWSFSI